MDNALQMYLDFRKEMDTYCFPLLKEWAGDDFVEIKDGDDVVGFLMIIDKYYVEGIYVKPECRRKGIARKAVIDYVKNGGKITRLHIIKSNKPALKFWKSIFKLKKLDECPSDILYEVKGLKEIKQ